MSKPKEIYIVASVTNKPDAWELKAKKGSKAIHFVLGVGDTRLSKQDIKFINNHLKKLEAIKDTINDGESVEAGN